MVKLVFANIVRCFDDACVGTRVRHGKRQQVLDLLIAAIESFDWSKCRTPGQAFIPLPQDVCDMVNAGVGEKTKNPEDYVVREWRGECHMYLKRQFALPCDSVAAIVYTKEAYLDDPDVKGDPEKGIPRDTMEFNQISESDCTHVLVILLADSGPKAPVSAGRFVANLAGGNNEFALMSKEELVALAIEVRDYYRKYSTVAD